MLEHLNEEQIEVVTHFEGPMLVLAGAGSGKTRAITHRIAYLVNHYGVNPSEIVALTFTNKAAKEMLQRLQSFPKGGSLRGVTATTFHSFGLILLKENASLLGINQNFQVIDDDDQTRLLKEALSITNISKDDFPPKKFKAFLESWKNEGGELKDVLDETFFADFLKDIYGKVITKYEQLKEERGLFDFGDLLLKLLTGFGKNQQFLEKCRKRFRFLLVDEYQDTNAIQYKILKKLSLPHKNIVVVGDDDQSIYSFRGAEIRNILDFKKDFPEAKIVKLVKNYRSTKTIIDVANKVISRNRNRMEKVLHSTKSVGERIKIYVAEDEREEAAYVMRETKSLLAKGYSYKDIAVFYRTNVLSRRFEDLLRREKIPYKIFGSIRFYNRKEIKDIVAFIRFLLNKQDILSFSRLSYFAILGVGKTTIDKILSKVNKETDVVTAINSYIAESSPNTRTTLSLKSFLTVIKTLETALSELSPEDFIDKLLEVTAYRDFLKKDVKDDKELDEKMKNIEELKLALVENKKEGKDYNDFINDVILGDLDKEESSDYLTLMTVHSAKGLEFPVVFITAVEDDIFPHVYSKLEKNEEEERRLFYVAITRAMEKLYITRAKQRNYKTQKPSPFLEDIPEALFHGNTNSYDYSRFKREVEKPFFTPLPEIKTSKEVLHNTFGRGKIIDTVSEGDVPVYAVRFEDGTVRKILGSFLREI
ncbi:MAG: DNA helicase PcrA [bacterium]